MYFGSSVIPHFLPVHNLMHVTWIICCIHIVSYSESVYVPVTMVKTRGMAALTDPTTPPSTKLILQRFNSSPMRSIIVSFSANVWPGRSGKFSTRFIKRMWENWKLIPCMIHHHLLLWRNIHVHRGQSSQERVTIGVGKCLLFTFIALLLLFHCIWARRLGSSHDSIVIAIASGLIWNGQKMLLDIIIIKNVIQEDIVIRIVQSFPQNHKLNAYTPWRPPKRWG